MDDIIGSTIGGCTIESKIGEGGMGCVYKAHHIALDIPVAVKVLHRAGDILYARERFLREARIAARLRHQHIVGVLNVGNENGIDFIVMEYVDGENLLSTIKRKGKLPPEEAVTITIAVLEALGAAFENNIIHRDIKPENILIDKKGIVKLADLGVARCAEDINLTKTDTVLGSPLYISPEQAENPRAVDCRSDIYSLGCTFYYMLTGEAPFKGNTVVEVIMQHLKKPAPLLVDVLPCISPELSSIVAKMMEKEPSKRFQTPLEAEDALKKYQQKMTSSLITASDRNRNIKLIPMIIILAAGVGAASLFFLNIRNKPCTLSSQQSAVKDTANVIAIVHETQPDSDNTPNEKKPKKIPGKAGKTIKNKPFPAPISSDIKPPRPAPVKTRVFSAVKIGDLMELKHLLEKGNSPNAPFGSSTTPLHEAVRQGSTEAVELLLKFGADPNVKDVSGDTPLHYALRDGATLITNILLKYGANPNIADHTGRTPLSIAGSTDTETEKLLRKFGAR